MSRGSLWTLVTPGAIYRYAPGASFTSVYSPADPYAKTPVDMIEMPPWVNRSQLDETTWRALVEADLLRIGPLPQDES